jgi:hypothetical protein
MHLIASKPSKRNREVRGELAYKARTAAKARTRWMAKQVVCTDGMASIVRDTWHPWEYRACADEQDAVAIAADENRPRPHHPPRRLGPPRSR